MKKSVNGKIVEMTPEEEARHMARRARAAIEIQAFKDAEAVKQVNKASGKQKLKDIGLNDEEIKALIGI